MVFESLLDDYKKYNHPLFVFVMGALYATIAVIISYFFFQREASYFIVFFTSIMSFHFIYTTIRQEESYDFRLATESQVMQKHLHLIILFVTLYFGFFTSFTFWNVVLPESQSAQLFAEQDNSINLVNAKIISGKQLSTENLKPIFVHNIQVLVFSVFFSFLFGAGAIFILVWNASVGGVFIGEVIRTKILTFSPPAAILIGMIRYLPHAVFEFAGYFTGALAGGIISVALIKHDFLSDKFYKVLYDTTELLIISVLLIFLGAVVEVFVTPVLVAQSSNLFAALEQFIF